MKNSEVWFKGLFQLKTTTVKKQIIKLYPGQRQVQCSNVIESVRKSRGGLIELEGSGIILA